MSSVISIWFSFSLFLSFSLTLFSPRAQLFQLPFFYLAPTSPLTARCTCKAFSCFTCCRQGVNFLSQRIVCRRARTRSLVFFILARSRYAPAFLLSLPSTYLPYSLALSLPRRILFSFCPWSLYVIAVTASSYVIALFVLKLLFCKSSFDRN